MTYGEWLVGISFNPGNSDHVSDIKQKAAALIDAIESCGNDDRCTDLAVNAFEEGAMWAVKSITKQPRESDDADKD